MTAALLPAAGRSPRKRAGAECVHGSCSRMPQLCYRRQGDRFLANALARGDRGFAAGGRAIASQTRWRGVRAWFRMTDRSAIASPTRWRGVTAALLADRSAIASSQTRWRGVRAWFLLSDAAALLPAAGRSPRKRAGAECVYASCFRVTAASLADRSAIASPTRWRGVTAALLADRSAIASSQTRWRGV